jgi:hypothetical protein
MFLELFSQAGKIEFEFSGIFRLSYLFSKLCLYIPIACVLSHFFTLLANFLAIVIPESELKVLALLVALISFLTSVSLEYYSLNRVTFLSKGQNRAGVRNIIEIVDAFFVLPVVYVIALDENFEVS